MHLNATSVCVCAVGFAVNLLPVLRALRPTWSLLLGPLQPCQVWDFLVGLYSTEEWKPDPEQGFASPKETRGDGGHEVCSLFQAKDPSRGQMGANKWGEGMHWVTPGQLTPSWCPSPLTPLSVPELSRPFLGVCSAQHNKPCSSPDVYFGAHRCDADGGL